MTKRQAFNFDAFDKLVSDALTETSEHPLINVESVCVRCGYDHHPWQCAE